MGKNLTTQQAEFSSFCEFGKDDRVEFKYRVFHNKDLDRVVVDQYYPNTGITRGSVSMDTDGARELLEILNRMLDDKYVIPPTDPRRERPTIQE